MNRRSSGGRATNARARDGRATHARAVAGKPGHRPAHKPGRSGGSGPLFVALLIVLVLGAVVLPTAILFGAGMIPSMVALVVDRDPQRPAALSVAPLNFCGVMPFAVRLWQSGHDMATATSILGDPLTWVAMYGAAGIGWVVYFLVPPLVAKAVVMRDEGRIDRLLAQRVDLVRQWGPEVMGRHAAGSDEEDDAPAADARG